MPTTEKHKKACKKWVAKNRERLNEYHNAYYHNDKTYKKDFYLENKDKYIKTATDRYYYQKEAKRLRNIL